MTTHADTLRQQARTILEQRGALFDQRAQVADDKSMTANARTARITALDAELDRMADEVRSLTDRAEAEDEVRSMSARVNTATGAQPERRDAFTGRTNRQADSFLAADKRLILPTLSEYRALDSADGAAVIPSEISQRVFDSVRLTSPILSAVTVLPMGSGDLVVPVVDGVNASLVDEGTPIPASEQVINSVTLKAVKGAALVKSSNEAFADAASDALRALVARDLVGAYSEAVSGWLISGHTNVNVSGLSDLALAATLTATTMTERISEAIAEQRAAGLEPTGVMLSPADHHRLRTEVRDTSGEFLFGGSGAASRNANGQETIFGVPLILAPQATEVYVLAGDRVVAGLRADFQLAYDSSGANFESDLTSVRVLGRFAGLRKTADKAVLSVPEPV